MIEHMGTSAASEHGVLSYGFHGIREAMEPAVGGDSPRGHRAVRGSSPAPPATSPSPARPSCAAPTTGRYRHAATTLRSQRSYTVRTRMLPRLTAYTKPHWPKTHTARRHRREKCLSYFGSTCHWVAPLFGSDPGLTPILILTLALTTAATLARAQESGAHLYGVWSWVRSMAVRPPSVRSASTARESPTFATTSFLPYRSGDEDQTYGRRVARRQTQSVPSQGETDMGLEVHTATKG